MAHFCNWKVVQYYFFHGGTGATPTVNADSSRLFVSDDNNVIALDKNLNFLRKVDAGEQVCASIAVVQDNNEIYAVKQTDIIKIVDEGTSGRILCRATLDAYPSAQNVNALTATVTVNGVVVSVAAVRKLPFMKGSLAFRYGMALLDRQTGRIRYFAEGIEESISVSVVGPDGSYYMALSPLRHSIMKGLVGGFMSERQIPSIRGGISRFKPTHMNVMAREAFCAASDRLDNALEYVAMFEGQEAEEHRSRQAVEEDLRWSAVLVRQGNQAIQSIASKEPAIVAKTGQDFPASLRTALSTTSEEVSVFTAASDLTGKAVAARKFCALLDKFQRNTKTRSRGHCPHHSSGPAFL